MKLSRAVQLGALTLICALLTIISCSKKESVPKPAPEKASVKVAWDKVVTVSKTAPTLQVVVMPPLRRGSKIHDRVFQALHDLGADYVRYVPWLPYPKLAVAELEPPKDGQTSWDFSLIDPMMEDFMNATPGHSVVMNFSTIPQWMFKTEKPVPYPADPDGLTWTYEQGKELRDPSRKELANYYARLVSWYTQGGFTDEAGKRHESGHHYKIDYWEVFNEVDDEHSMTPQDYTASYDAIVGAIRQVAPQMKFVSLALDSAENHMQFHGVLPGPSPPQAGDSAGHGQLPLLRQAHAERAAGSAAVHVLQSGRSIPGRGALGRIHPPAPFAPDPDGPRRNRVANRHRRHRNATRLYVAPPIPNSYWNLSGAMYAYLYGELAKLGIEVAGESQLVGYPTQWPSVSMVDWDTGQPNARFWVLKLLRTNFGPGDKLVETRLERPRFTAWVSSRATASARCCW